jgi:hypothetical protein
VSLIPEDTPERRAILSLLDVVEELAWTVEDKGWSALVSNTFNKHRRELRTGEIEQSTTTGQFPKRRPT